MNKAWKTPFLLKSLCLATLVIVLALAGYWVKCQLGVDIFPGYFWEEHLPFLNSFQKIERVIRPTLGEVFISTFDEVLPRYDWSKTWARDAGTVRDDIVPAGLHSSKALRIRSKSPRDWALPSSLVIEVYPGDTFIFSGYGRTTADATSRMSVTFYDARDKVTKWDGAFVAIKGPKWQQYTSRTVVTQGTARVRFRLAGDGIGECYFDDIALIRVK